MPRMVRTLLVRPMLIALLGLSVGLAAGCTPPAPVIVLAPSATPAGAVVPTRAPTLPATATPTTVPATAPGATEPPPAPTTRPELGIAGESVTLAVPIASVGSAWSGAISDLSPWAIYPLRGAAGEAVDLKVEGVNDLDPLVLLLDPDGREIARSESASGQESLIEGASLISDGSHYVVVTRAGGRDGETTGGFTLTITEGAPGAQSGDFTLMAAYDSLATGQISADQPRQTFTFAGRARDLVTAQVTAGSGDLDTRLELRDALGNLLAANDDDPLAVGRFDSALHRFLLPADGYYALTVSGFGATTGEFSVKLTREGEAPLADGLAAPLNVLNSASVRDDGVRVTDYRAGDQWTDDGRELPVQTLLTFRLPAQGRTGATAARLILNACTEMGAPFAGLGPLAVYTDPYGSMAAPRDFAQPTVGARLLGTLNACASLDVSEAVAAALNAGETAIQFRLAFPGANANEQTDEIRFEPRLLISAAEG